MKKQIVNIVKSFLWGGGIITCALPISWPVGGNATAQETEKYENSSISNKQNLYAPPSMQICQNKCDGEFDESPFITTNSGSSQCNRCTHVTYMASGMLVIRNCDVDLVGAINIAARKFIVERHAIKGVADDCFGGFGEQKL